MDTPKDVQHVYLIGAKGLGSYGGYETFVYKLTEYHKNNEHIKYHVACKANGDGCMVRQKLMNMSLRLIMLIALRFTSHKLARHRQFIMTLLH